MTDDFSSYYRKLRKDCETFGMQSMVVLNEHQKQFSVVRMKDDVDLATSADIASEKLLVSLIRDKYPEHGIESEESEARGGKSGFVWILDPLDGTKEYARGLTEYNCLLAVEHKRTLVACAVVRNTPAESYSAAKGSGATLNGIGIAVSKVGEIEKSLVGFHIPTRSSNRDEIDRSINTLRRLITSSYRIRPGWDDAKMLGLVTRGAIDAHIICAKVNKWHDVASGLLLVEEAGGTVTDWKGNTLHNHDLSCGIVASNGKLHDQLLKIINLS